MNDKTNSDNKDSTLSFMKDFIKREEETIKSDTKYHSIEDKEDK